MSVMTTPTHGMAYQPPPWGQGRGSKLLEVTFLATLQYIHPLYIKGPSGQAGLCGGVPVHVRPPPLKQGRGSKVLAIHKT